MKRIVPFLFVICMIVLCGCGGKQSTQIVSMYDLRQSMEAADDSLPEMLNASSEDKKPDELLKNVSDMDYSKVHSFFISYAKDGGKPEEIVVIAVKKQEDVEEAKKSLEDHKQKRHNLLEEYEPESVKEIDDGIVFTKGSYAVLIVSQNKDAVRKAFEESVSK